MPDRGMTTAKVLAAAGGTGMLGFMWGLLRFEGKFVKVNDCLRSQEQCNRTLQATLTAIQNDLAEIKAEQQRFREDFYLIRGSK